MTHIAGVARAPTRPRTTACRFLKDRTGARVLVRHDGSCARHVPLAAGTSETDVETERRVNQPTLLVPYE
jgi:hypothetical protein